MLENTVKFGLKETVLFGSHSCVVEDWCSSFSWPLEVFDKVFGKDCC